MLSIVSCKTKILIVKQKGLLKLKFSGGKGIFHGCPAVRRIGFGVSIWYSVVANRHNTFRRSQGSIRQQDDVSVGATASRRRQDVAEE